jgi:hypothetical protein
MCHFPEVVHALVSVNCLQIDDQWRNLKNRGVYLVDSVA